MEALDDLLVLHERISAADGAGDLGIQYMGSTRAVCPLCLFPADVGAFAQHELVCGQAGPPHCSLTAGRSWPVPLRCSWPSSCMAA